MVNVVINFIHEEVGFGLGFGRKAADGDRESAVEGRGGIVAEVAIEVVAGVGLPFGVEGGWGLVGDDGGLVCAEDVAVVVSSFAEEEEVAWGVGIVGGGFGAQTAKQLANGYGVGFARGEFVEDLLLGDDKSG